MDNTAPNNNDGHHNSHNDSDSTSFDNALIITSNTQNHEEQNEFTEAEVRNTMRVAGGSGLESEEATSTSEAVTSVSSTEVESLAASLIRAQEEHRRAEAEKVQEEKTEVEVWRLILRRAFVITSITVTVRNQCIFRMSLARRIRRTKTFTMSSGSGEHNYGFKSF